MREKEKYGLKEKQREIERGKSEREKRKGETDRDYIETDNERMRERGIEKEENRGRGELANYILQINKNSDAEIDDALLLLSSRLSFFSDFAKIILKNI